MTATIPTWHATALCATEPGDWFADSPVLVEQAKAVCGRCAVSARCGSEAIQRGEVEGIWGGLDLADRLALGMVLPDPWHGTPAGVKAHGCDCRPCKTAHARDVAAWRSRRRWAATTRGLIYPVQELEAPSGRGKHRAYEHQLFFDLEVAA